MSDKTDEMPYKVGQQVDYKQPPGFDFCSNEHWRTTKIIAIDNKSKSIQIDNKNKEWIDIDKIAPLHTYTFHQITRRTFHSADVSRYSRAYAQPLLYQSNDKQRFILVSTSYNALNDGAVYAYHFDQDEWTFFITDIFYATQICVSV